MKSIPTNQLESKFGADFVIALRHAVASESETQGHLEAWNVAQAKNRFSEVLARARTGECQLVCRHSDEPLLVMSMSQLADFVKQAKPSRRFADLFAFNPNLPIGEPLLISETPVGIDEVEI